MKPPKEFKINARVHGYSICDGCGKWRFNLHFYHEGSYWILCDLEYADYWENTDELQSDFRWFG